MCKSDVSWKREVVPEHKFDFIDVREFTDKGFAMRLKYVSLYALVLITFLFYMSDIFTAITKATSISFSTTVDEQCKTINGCLIIPTEVNKWLFIGCIIFSFLLLAWEARKAKKIIASRDISYSFTNVMANRYYALRSYDHFCFFDHISNSTKKKDDFAFFIFFTFKSWKQVLLADAPRQVLNGFTIYEIILTRINAPGAAKSPWWYLPKYFTGSWATKAVIVSTVFAVLFWAVSFLLLVIASLGYVPLLCYIQGNLKEYVCHKVDKRIAEFIKKRNKVKHARAAKIAALEAQGDFSHLKNKKGEIVGALPQPTLPQLSVDDDDEAARKEAILSKKGNLPPPIADYGMTDYKSEYTNVTDYPPMPGYAYPTDPSAVSLHDAESYYHGQGMYEDEYATSQAHLTASAAPLAGADYGSEYHQNMYSAYPHTPEVTSANPLAAASFPSALSVSEHTNAPSPIDAYQMHEPQSAEIQYQPHHDGQQHDLGWQHPEQQAGAFELQHQPSGSQSQTQQMEQQPIHWGPIPTHHSEAGPTHAAQAPTGQDTGYHAM